ncbi:hypothetical protein F4861DRAFT_367826 [Xylaria intraflava]|nr:hypothetical protein F4861DRAFT_367826 [Xylaria intraflava]
MPASTRPAVRYLCTSGSGGVLGYLEVPGARAIDTFVLCKLVTPSCSTAISAARSTGDDHHPQLLRQESYFTHQSSLHPTTFGNIASSKARGFCLHTSVSAPFERPNALHGLQPYSGSKPLCLGLQQRAPIESTDRSESILAHRLVNGTATTSLTIPPNRSHLVSYNTQKPLFSWSWLKRNLLSPQRT